MQQILFMSFDRRLAVFLLDENAKDGGDTIKLTTKLGTRSYTVYSVRKVSVNDVSVLDSTGENIVTLVTCVMNQPDYRWCVQARQK